MNNQCNDVLKCLEKRGFIDQKLASEFYGIGRLSARIFNLRQQGYVIETTSVRFKNRHGHIGHFARYVI